MTDDFKKRFVGEGMSKLGFWKTKAPSLFDKLRNLKSKGPIPVVKRTGQWLPFIGLSAAVSTLGQTLNMFIGKLMESAAARREKTMSKDYYKTMLENHPTLLKEDPDVVMKY